MEAKLQRILKAHIVTCSGPRLYQPCEVVRQLRKGHGIGDAMVGKQLRSSCMHACCLHLLLRALRTLTPKEYRRFL